MQSDARPLPLPQEELCAAAPSHPGSLPPQALADAFAAPARDAARRRYKAWAMTALRVGFAVAGVVALVLLIRDAGTGALLAILAPAAKWLPLALLIEAARIALDGLATYLALGGRARALPLRVLTRAQLIGAAISGIAPAGRAAAEAMKAALIAPWTGGAAATTAAATSQAATLISSGLISVPCAWAAWRMTGGSLVTVLLLVHAVALVLGGAGMQLLLRARRISGWLERRLGRFARGATSFQQTAREAQVFAPRPTAVLLAGRVLQVAQFAILAYAAGVNISTVSALFSQGLNLIALAAGTLVPGQIGVSEGTFVLSASALGTTEANAMAIALLARIVQSVVIPIGAVIPIIWKAETPKSGAAA